MLPADDCDECKPAYARRSLEAVPSSTILLSSTPLVLTWLVVVVIARRRLFPNLSSEGDAKDELPVFNKSVFQHSWRERIGAFSSKRLASWVFSASIGLSAVLVELLLCEISDALNPAARGLALRVTLASLMILSIIITPALEIHGITKSLFGAPADSTSTRKSKPTFRLVVELAIFAAWLLVFWYIPQTSLLRNTLRGSERSHFESSHVFTEACLERIGIIGISLMASLSGFAAVSSLWQTFGVRHRPIKDADISRKAAGLAATEEMLNAKQSRIRALERKMSEASSPAEQTGFMGRVIGSFRPSKDVQELVSLRMEVSGLHAMRFTLSNSLSGMRARRADQDRSKTQTGRFLNLANLIFAIYCAYRIVATSFSSLRRWWNPAHSFATSDPINNFLALLTTHLPSSMSSDLDRAAMARQISFLLSGIMLFASFNAVLQTFRVFARFAPALIQHAQTSLPLIISQIAGTYVISSALLLRSNLPAEVSNVITEALGAPLEAKFVEGWFESWFLVAVGLTATGILVGRKVGGSDDDWDDDGIEMGKRH